MLPILLVIALVAPPAASPSEQSSATQEARRAEQARAEMAAREAARIQAQAERDVLERVRAVEREQAGPEQAKVRERRLAEIAQAVESGIDARRTQEQELAKLEVEQLLMKQGLAVRRDESAAAIEIERALKASRWREQREAIELPIDRAQIAMSRNELAIVENQLRSAERTLTRQRELFEKGLVTEDALRSAEERLTAARLLLERSQIQTELMEQGSRQLGDSRELEYALLGLSRDRGEALDESAVLQPQDRLTITVASEPDLPTTFEVRPDGSIRFPFLGSIRVQGSTSAQVQSAIRKLLSDRGLVTNATVSVSARRAR